jgi:hypothetical protein
MNGWLKCHLESAEEIIEFMVCVIDIDFHNKTLFKLNNCLHLIKKSWSSFSLELIFYQKFDEFKKICKTC